MYFKGNLHTIYMQSTYNLHLLYVLNYQSVASKNQQFDVE